MKAVELTAIVGVPNSYHSPGKISAEVKEGLRSVQIDFGRIGAVFVQHRIIQSGASVIGVHIKVVVGVVGGAGSL